LNEHWQQLYQQATSDTETAIRKQENEDHVKRIEKLIIEVLEKNKALNVIHAEVARLTNEKSDQESSEKDETVGGLKTKLDALNKEIDQLLADKNNIYDELAKNTKDLISKDDIIQKNSQEIAKLKTELEVSRKTLVQKQKIAEDLRTLLEEKNRQIAELREQLAQRKSTIDELELRLKDKESEAEELEQMIEDKDKAIIDLQRQIEEIEEAKKKKPAPPAPEPKKVVVGDYRAHKGDLVDELLA
jgi:chromosome segregation ATPase